MKTFLSLLLLVLSFARSVRGAEEARATQEFNGDPFDLSDWFVIGPIASDSDQDALSRDYLKAMVPSGEATATFAALARGAAAKSGLSSPLETRYLSRQGYVSFLDSLGIPNPTSADAPAPTFYLATRILSKEPRRAHLLVGSFGLIQVWHNGVIQSPRVPRLTAAESSLPFAACIPLDLQAGENLLLFKVARVQETWCGLVATLAGDVDSALAEAVEQNGSIFRDLILQPRTRLTFEVRGAPESVNLPLEIRNAAGATVAAVTLAKNPSSLSETEKLEEDLYTVAYQTRYGRLTEEFAIGNIEALARRAAARLEKAGKTQEDRNNIGALTRRIGVLTTPTNVKPDDREWQRKMIYTISEMESATSRLSRGESAWTHVPGLHLRGLVSELDGTVRHYRIFMPSTYDRNHPPGLAIILPTTLSASRPFIESPFVAKHVQAERFTRIAERLNLALLWPGYPAEPYGNPPEYRYTDDVLQQVCRDYAVDQQRLYLLGTCRSGMTATMMAERYPGRFAALALLNPLNRREKNRAKGEPNFAAFPAYNQWLMQLAPLRHLDRIRGLPIRIVFDGGGEGHGTVEDAQEFIENARLAQVEAEYRETNRTFRHFGAWQEMLEWVAQQRKENIGEQLAPELARWDRAGPIAGALAGGFVLVVGSQGNADDLAAMQRIADDFVGRWQRTYHGPCRVLRDTEITPEIARKYTLVLIGNAKKNRLWARIDGRIPVSITSASVTAYGNNYQQPRLSLQAVVPHPDLPGKQVVLIGSEDLRKAAFGPIELSIDGWFDYAVWQADRQGGAKLMAAALRSDRPAKLQLATSAGHRN